MTAKMPTYVQAIVKDWDRVLLAIAAIVLILAIWQPQQAIATLQFVASSLQDVVPFLLLSIAAAAYAKASGADNLIGRVFDGHVHKSIVLAALMGAFSPFCSCGVIPLIAALLSIGVPLPAVMAFWLSSPLMDPSMFALTLGTLGSQFAVGKTVATISIGLFGGFGLLPLMGQAAFANPLKDSVGNGGCGGSKIRNPKAVVWRFWHEGDRTQAFWKGAWDSLFFLGKWLLLAFVLESLMLAYVPDTLVQSLAGDGNLLSVAIAAAVGIPAYLNGYAALPLIDGLVQQGMAQGAGMAFLLAGGATSIPAAIAVYAIARKPVFYAYLAFAFVGSVASGLLFELLI
ncbi:MAG: permease [Synechococcus sp.]